MSNKQDSRIIRGFSVTQRIRQVKQPRGGYINPRLLMEESLGDSIDTLNPIENVPPTLVGLVVDYLTRYFTGTPIEEAFQVSLLGSYFNQELDFALELLSRIDGLEDNSIISATKLVGYDVIYRAGLQAYSLPVSDINPDSQTISNIRDMVKRSLNFFETRTNKVLDGFTFDGGYTDLVVIGDGDFLSEDTLWDFKVSKYPPTKEATLQLLMYWRMGLHSIHPEFKSIKYLGIYNPRLNKAYTIPVKDISEEVILEVERAVIGYK